MSATVYAGYSRAVPRWIITVVASVMAIVLGVRLALNAPNPHTAEDTPALMRAFFAAPILDAIVAFGALYSLSQFGRRRSPLLWGSVALVLLGFMTECIWALMGGADREFFILGGVLFGWVFGLGFARALAARLKETWSADRNDVYGEAGAAGVFAAVYLGAFVSKALTAGTGWLDGAHLLAVVVRRHPMNFMTLSNVYVDALMRWPFLTDIFIVAALIIQGGAFMYLVSPFWRIVWGTLILSFHLNVYLLMDVRYITPILISIGLSYPWPQIVAKLRGKTPVEVLTPQPVDAGAVRAVAWRASLAILGCGLLASALWFAVHSDDPYRDSPSGRPFQFNGIGQPPPPPVQR